MRTHGRRATAVATAAFLLAAMTSCASNGNSDPDPKQTDVPSSASPTTSTTPSESDRAAEAASALVRKYYATVDQLSQNTGTGLGQLSSVATSTQLSAQRNALRSQRQDAQRQTGSTKIVQVNVESVNLANSDAKSGKVPTVQLDVCWDVSEVDVVNAEGQSVVAPTRPNTGWTGLTVANYDYKNDPVNGWRVATGQDIERTPCDAS